MKGKEGRTLKECSYFPDAIVVDNPENFVAGKYRITHQEVIELYNCMNKVLRSKRMESEQ